MAPRARSVLCGTGISKDTPSLILSDPCDPNSPVCWNSKKDFQRWFFVSGVGPNGTFPIDLDPAPAISTVAHNVAPDGMGSGAQEVCALFGTSSVPGARWATLLADSRTKRQYSNVPIPNNLMYGTKGTPPSYNSTIYIPATNALTGNIVSLSAGAQLLSLSAYGRRFVDREGAELEASRSVAFFSRRIHSYWLGPDRGPVVALGAGLSVQILMTVPSGARFDALHLLDDSDGGYNVQIFDGQSNRSFMDRPLPREHVFVLSTATAPAIFQAGLSPCTWSQSFVPESTITFQITDTSGAPNNIRIAVLGRLIYADGDPAAAVPPPSSRELPLPYLPYATPWEEGDCPPKSKRAARAMRAGTPGSSGPGGGARQIGPV